MVKIIESMGVCRGLLMKIFALVWLIALNISAFGQPSYLHLKTYYCTHTISAAFYSRFCIVAQNTVQLTLASRSIFIFLKVTQLGERKISAAERGRENSLLPFVLCMCPVSVVSGDLSKTTITKCGKVCLGNCSTRSTSKRLQMDF